MANLQVNHRYFCHFLFLALVLLMGSSPAYAHCAIVHAKTAKPATSKNSATENLVKDPTASVSTKIFVMNQRVRVTLEEFTDDLVWLHGMEANDQGIFPAETLREYYDIHQKFLADNLRLELADGTVLVPVLTDRGVYPFDDDLLKSGATEFHLVKRKMSFTYEFKSDRQIDTLTIRHKFVDDNFLYPAELSIELFQGSSDLSVKSKLRVDTPMTIAFDWNNPIPSLSASPEEIAKWMESQQERMLGVTEFGSVYCWGYIEPRRLRVELLFPLNVLETMFEIPAADPNYLTATEMEVAAEKIVKYFEAGNPVSIDGKVVPPQPSKVDFFPADQRDFAIKTKIEKLSFSNGRVGITIHYPYRKVPQQMELRWDKFSHAVNTVQAYFYFGDQVVAETFSRQVSDNRIVWNNPGNWEEPTQVIPVVFAPTQVSTDNSFGLAVIVGMAALVGLLSWLVVPSESRSTKSTVAVLAAVMAGILTNWFLPKPLNKVTGESTQTITESIFQNIYHAFEFSDEEEIYDQLSHSVSGTQLRELYLQLLSGLTAEEQGGAVSSIESVEVIQVEAAKDPVSRTLVQDLTGENSVNAGYRAKVRWNLRGLVEHWGHSHERTNQYNGDAVFAAIDGQWKLVQLIVQSQDPGLTKPRPRKFRRQSAPPETN